MPVMFEAYLITLAALVAMQVAPGPNLIAVAGAAMGQGRRVAIMVVFGVATGVALWVAFVAAGLGTLMETYPSLITGLKLLGGSYLLFLGLKGLYAAWKGDVIRLGNSGGSASLPAAWAKGFFVVLTNPKAALAWAGMASFLFGSGLEMWQVVAFAPLAMLSTIGVYGTYALLLSTDRAARAYRHFWRSIDAVFGCLFGAMGGSLLLAGLQEARS